MQQTPPSADNTPDPARSPAGVLISSPPPCGGDGAPIGAIRMVAADDRPPQGALRHPRLSAPRVCGVAWVPVLPLAVPRAGALSSPRSPQALLPGVPVSSDAASALAEARDAARGGGGRLYPRSPRGRSLRVFSSRGSPPSTPRAPVRLRLRPSEWTTAVWMGMVSVSRVLFLLTVLVGAFGSGQWAAGRGDCSGHPPSPCGRVGPRERSGEGRRWRSRRRATVPQTQAPYRRAGAPATSPTRGTGRRTPPLRRHPGPARRSLAPDPGARRRDAPPRRGSAPPFRREIANNKHIQFASISARAQPIYTFYPSFIRLTNFHAITALIHNSVMSSNRQTGTISVRA